jgi:ABC-type nitrate/sulfonate/bicarbonate transport system permease component
MTAASTKLPAGAGSARRSGRLGRAAGSVLLRIVAPLVGIAAWEVAAWSAQSLWFPPPSAIFAQMQQLWLSGPAPTFFTHAVVVDILPSVARMLAGLAIATVTGIVLGFVIGRSRVAALTTGPIISFLRSTPGPALLPVFLLLFGTDSTMRIALIAFAALWPVLLNTIDGVRAVDPTQLETARAYGLPARARISRVVLPAASPKIFAGITVALAIALTLMVVSELTVATDGIGYQIQRATQVFQLTDMWAGILLIALLGLLFNIILEVVERRTLRWYRGSKRRND